MFCRALTALLINYAAFSLPNTNVIMGSVENKKIGRLLFLLKKTCIFARYFNVVLIKFYQSQT